MNIAEISKVLESSDDKGLIASVKKTLRAYEQTFSEDVDVLGILQDIDQFFARMQERYENAFTVRNILSGQQKLLDLPMVRERLSDSLYKHLQTVTRSRAATFTKTANDLQRSKTMASKEDSNSNPGPDIEEALPETVSLTPNAAENDTNTSANNAIIEEQRGRIDDQMKLIDDLNGTVSKLRSFIQALKVILDLVD